MRKYSVLMMLALISMLLIGLQLSAMPTATPAIEAEVNIHPEVFNLNQRGVITAHVSNLTEEDVSYDIEDVDVSTIMLYHQSTPVAEPLRVTVADDTLIVTFDATTVAGYVWSVIYHMGIIPPIWPQADYTMEFTVLGTLFGGEEFAGKDTIKIIAP